VKKLEKLVWIVTGPGVINFKIWNRMFEILYPIKEEGKDWRADKWTFNTWLDSYPDAKVVKGRKK
jgi:hypothetical protein